MINGNVDYGNVDYILTKYYKSTWSFITNEMFHILLYFTNIGRIRSCVWIVFKSVKYSRFNGYVDYIVEKTHLGGQKATYFSKLLLNVDN